VTHESEWREEWAILRAERDLARRRWRSAADGLAARARDPLGLGDLVRAHPVVAGGIGAAAVALLVQHLAGRPHPRGDDKSPSSGAGRPGATWTGVLRDAVLSVGVPWLLRTLKTRFGWDAAAAVQSGSPPPADDARGGAVPGSRGVSDGFGAEPSSGEREQRP
jgi:hypothetical protein